MKKNTNWGLIIIGCLVVFALGGWIYLLSKNQKTISKALADANDKLDVVANTLNLIAYRNQVIDLANAELQLIQAKQKENIKPIGFKIS